MNIGLLAVDSTYPNLALMKISAYHKARGDSVNGIILSVAMIKCTCRKFSALRPIMVTTSMQIR